MAPLLRFAAAEVKRRLTHQAVVTVPAGGGKKGAAAAGHHGGDGGVAADLDDIVGVLQRSENHLLALKVPLRPQRETRTNNTRRLR